MRELAVDFGTSNTVAALRTEAGGPARLLAVDGWPVLPSAVWLPPGADLAGPGALVVGRDAERQARLDPARYEPNPKRRIDEVEVLLGDTVVAVVDLIAAVLRRVLDEATRQLGGPADRLVLTHPAGWGAIRCRTLAAAARRAGATGEVQLLPEPVAAAAHFAQLPGHTLAEPGQALAVYDLGGGTTDTAVVARTVEGWQVLAEAGLADVGGRDMDQLLLEHIGWQLGSGRPEWTALQRPTDPASRRAARALADDVRAAKEALSRYPQADVPLPPPLRDVHVTRAELEELVVPRLERTVALLASTIAVAGLRPDGLAGVYLVGGASRMPAVARLITERLGVLPVAVDSPECSVVLGALAAPPQRDVTDPRTVGGVFARQPAHEPVVVQQTAQLPAAPVPAPAPGQAPGPVFPPPRPRRRGLVVALALVSVLAVAGAATAIGLALQGDNPGSANRNNPPTDESSTAPVDTSGSTPGNPLDDLDDLSLDTGAEPPEPVEVSVAGREAAFAGDTDLLRFARTGVDAALNCVDPKGITKQTLGLRTHVQCVYRAGDRLVYASFFSADSEGVCGQLHSLLTLTAGGADDSGQWEGGDYLGDWTDVNVNNIPATFYRAAGNLCGIVEADEDNPLDAAGVHAYWEQTVRPSS